MTEETEKRVSARTKLLEAAVTLIRKHGYCATSVEDLCKVAGVTKGAFFHHFKSKDDLGVAATKFWSETTGGLFASALYHQPEDPLERVLAYIDFRRDLIAGETFEYTCLVGTMVQETHESSPKIASACGDSIFGHAETLIDDIEEAISAYGLTPDWTASNLANHTQAVIQGGFILAKAGGGSAAAIETIEHLKRYVTLLFKGENHDRQNRN